MIKRRLQVDFERAVSTASQKPEVAEVVLVPLASPGSTNDQTAIVGSRQVVKVTLKDPVNTVIFELVPTDYPGLTERVPYRIAWRVGYPGRTFSHDFSMPDFDCKFTQLEDLGLIIDGEVYLQQSDLGVVNRVAKLDEDGDVVNAFGVKITGQGDASAVQGNLDAEIVERQQADASLRIMLEQELAAQISSVLATTQSKLMVEVGKLENADLTEKTARTNAVNALNASLSELETETNESISDILDTLQDQATTLLSKADLVGGKVPTSQLPAVALGNAVPVADEAEMLALTTSQVQPGDLAVRPDGSWMLIANPPSDIDNWLKISTGGEVLSVNGQVGVVVLAASDVGARSSSSPVPFNDVTGLSTLNTQVQGIDTRLTAVEGDPLIVRLNEDGVIEAALLSDTVAFVNVSGQLVKKDGTPIVVSGSGAVDSVNGKTGIVVLDAADVGARSSAVPVPASDVTGLEDALGDVVFNDDVRLTNARTPTTHKSTHAIGGTDVLTPADIGARSASVAVPSADVTGLDATLANHGTRINALEAGGPGGGGSAIKAINYDWVEATDDFDEVAIDSPFGYNPSNPNANADGFYYDPAGAADGEGVFVQVHESGYLETRRRVIGASPDPAKATQSALNALSTTVDSKADQTDLDATNTAVASKASQTEVNTLTTTVGTKAAQSALDSLTTTVGTKANQSDLAATNATVATKANQTALDSLTTTVGTKASQADLTTATGRITTVENALPTKADLVSGRVPLSQTPTNIPMTSIENLATTFSGKADLVGGKLPTSQLPALATTETYAVANRAAMLALTSAQVQIGDQCIITATTDKGTYTLISSDPSTYSSWMKHQQPDDLVSSVNGQTGTVVLSASDVGARSSSTPIAQSDVSGLTGTLANKASVTDLNTGLAGKTSPTDVNTLIGNSVVTKVLVDRVATSAVPSLSGQQSIDGALVALGTRVLLTAQSSSIQNGIWTVNSSAWTRVADMDVGSAFIRGTLILVSSGNANANTFWQQTNTSGIVGTNANNWSLVMRAGPPNAYTAGDGLDLSGTEFKLKPVSGGGLVATATGASVDPNVVVRKYAINVPGGLNPVTITHGLGTLDVDVVVREIGSGDVRLIGWNVSGTNTVVLDFGTTPAANQYRVVVQG